MSRRVDEGKPADPRGFYAVDGYAIGRKNA